LDQSKWNAPEGVRDIRNGAAAMLIQAAGKQSQISLLPLNQNTPYLEAKVTIDSASVLSTGASAIARLAGYLYNDSRGPGSGLAYIGYTGNVFAQVMLMMEDDRNLKAKIHVYSNSTPDESSGITLLSKDFTTPIFFNTAYTLGIGISGNVLTFKCADETITYTISTPVYPPYQGGHRQLRTRIYADLGESGFMKTYYDDVYIDDGNSLALAPLNLLLLTIEKE
jgi:hypothetical protein